VCLLSMAGRIACKDAGLILLIMLADTCRIRSRCMLDIPADFSVVLFRPNFVLFSEQNHVKVLKNQWLLTMP
jgi:hypothetical protein